MRNLRNSDQSYTGLVQKYIGSAYDIVHAVYLALEEIKSVAGIIDTPEWNELVKIGPHFEEFMRMLEQFHHSFYGAHSAPLVNDKGEYVRPNYDPDNKDSAPSQNGDMYYDKVRKGLYIFEDGAWERVGATSNQVEVIQVNASHIEARRAVIPLTHGYQPGTNGIMVFVNATFQYAVTASTPGGAYVETDSHHIEFPFNTHSVQGNLEEGDTITIMTGGVVTNVEHQFAVDLENHQVTLPQQTIFDINMGYIPGAHNLEVYVEGVRQVLGIDYRETDENTVTFIHPIAQNDLVIFKRGHVIGNSTGQGAENDFIVLDTVGEFYHRRQTLKQAQPVMLLGHDRIADGGSGIFIYVANMLKSWANGGTIIDSTKPLDQQGTSSGNGAWVRQYDDDLKFEWFGQTDALVENLTHIPVAKDGDRIWVNGYWQDGDGGEGMFYWDALQPKRNHDGGVIIDPHQVFPAIVTSRTAMQAWFTPTGGTNGCWIRLNKAEASISWFGAIGDGATDNAPVFEGIAIALSNNVVSSLRVPEGNFLYSSHWGTRVQSSNGLELYGEGYDSVLTLDSTGSDQPFNFQQCDSVTLRNLRMVDNRINTTAGYGFQFMEGSNLQIKDCVFENFKNSAVAFRGDPINSQAMHRITVTECTFKNCNGEFGPVILYTPGAISDELHITHNRFDQCNAYGGSPIILAGIAAHDAIIGNNFFENCQNDGVQVIGYEEVQVSENHFNNHAGTCIRVSVQDHPAYANADLNHALVRDNLMENVQGRGVLVEGDRTDNGPVVIQSNHMLGTQSLGIKVDTNGVRTPLVIVEGNHIEFDTSRTVESPVEIISADDPLIKDNLFLSNRAAPIDISGAINGFTKNNVMKDTSGRWVDVV